jgi:hypothetical protein
MKIIILLCSFILIPITFVYSQNKISLNGGTGYYLLNSENSNSIVGSKQFKWFFHFGFTYQRENLLGYNLLFEYSFHQMTKDDAIIFVRTGEGSPEPLGYIGMDLTLINHNFDFDLIENINQYFNYGFGPSFVITNRIVETNENAFGEHNLYDKLASSGIGVNGFLEVNLPLDESENYFFFNFRVKLRYTHSIWFDKGLRKLDDYSQDFFTSEIEVGIGYAF